MKLILIWLLFAFPCYAQTFTYYGFTGVGPDVYTTATSNDGQNWTNAGGAWNQQVNSPSILYYQGKRYELVSDATDTSHDLTTQRIGEISPSGTVSSFWAYNWNGAIPGVCSVFAGRFFVDASGTVHTFTPAGTACDNSNMQIYEMHALNTSLTQWSSPVLITVSGAPASIYDPVVFQVGTTFYLVTTEYLAGSGYLGYGAAECVSTASSLTGTYTLSSCSTTPSSNLYALNGTPWEGPFFYVNQSATDLQFVAEDIASGVREESTTTCAGPLLDTCTMGTPAAWTMDQTYRAGTVLRNPLSVPAVGAASGIM